MLEYSRNVCFLGRKDLMKVTHSVLEYRVLVRTRHAGIRVKMCVQINFFPSTSRVIRAGTQYFFNRKQRYHGHEISVKKVLDFSREKMLKIAGSVDKSGKQVVKTPRVLTPRC